MMSVIYKITNTENGKVYIGQTNDFQKRMNGHKSTSFNKNSSDYNLPIHAAIRKYGWDKFNKEIIEELPEDDQRLIDERERFFIEYFNSLISGNGYNINLGGQGFKRGKLTYEERLQCSSIFSPDELKDIQQMLRDEAEYEDIIAKYPKITKSFLSNINVGLAFNNPDWEYPLQKANHSRYSRAQIAQIKEMIKNPNIPYKDICEQFGIKSQGFLSMVNTGKYFFDENESYPLRVLKHGRQMAEQAQELLIKGDWSKCPTKTAVYNEVARLCGYNQIGSIKKIDLGATRRRNDLMYPLLSHQKENRLLFE